MKKTIKKPEFLLFFVLIIIVISYLFWVNNSKENKKETIDGQVDQNLMYTKDGEITTLSDGEKTVFVREKGTNKQYQLVVIDIDSNKEVVIFETGSIDKMNISNLPEYFPTDKIVNIYYPILSLDNMTVFFETDAWTTSGAIFSIDLKNKNIKYITDGNDAEIITEGEHRGQLKVFRRFVKKFEDNEQVIYCDYIVNSETGGNIEGINCDEIK